MCQKDERKITMKQTPSNFYTYSSKQREEFWLKNYEERRKIINDSYLSMIVDENGNLDKYKIIELILDLQDNVEDLKNTCQRTDSYYD
jgi:hypothetical protein